MSFGGGIGQYAERRATYAEHVEGWINQVAKSMPNLVDTGLFGDFNELDRQFFALSVAMTFGMEFTFEDGEDANGFLGWFVQTEHI